MMKPTVGRIVHVRSPEFPMSPLPAIIYQVNGETVVSVNMFTPRGAVVMASVEHETKSNGIDASWAWPKRDE